MGQSDSTSYAGIDYGLGQSNVDKANGIRFGVIAANDVGQAWYDASEAQYGSAHCPKCGNDAVEYDDALHGEFEQETCMGKPFGCTDYACVECAMTFDSQNTFPEEAQEFTYEDDGYAMSQGGDDTDIFIVKSPYYTRAQFCSPCAPGAGHLGNPCANGPKTYCLGHDWFEEGKAPYPVYRVADDAEVFA